MSHLTRYTVVLALSLCCGQPGTATISSTNAQNKTTKKPTGSVSGHITVKGKGKAGIVVGVRVSDFAPQLNPLSKATTDQEGNYRITDLPAGTYQIAPIAPAYVVPELNSFGSRGKPLILLEGERVEGIDFALVRGGVITGKVSLTDGRPVVEERIVVSLAEQTDGRSPSVQLSSAFQTDDRGVYRIFGLASGKYKVSVGQSQDSYLTVSRPGRPSYERVFYPDVTNPDEAKIIELSEGSEATNIDITVGQSIAGFAATGIVIDGETNQPLANLRLGLRRIVNQREASFIGSSPISNRLGEFRFEGLTPGKYAIFITPQPNSEQLADPVSFEVFDQDVSALRLKTSRGGSVSGTIILEGSFDKTVQTKLAQMNVQAYVRSETPGSGFVQTTSINPDGSFRVGGLQAGVAQLQLSAQDRGLVSGFVITRIERDGVVFARGVDIQPGEQISGLKVFVVYGSGIVRGMITVENGPLPTGARLLIQLSKPGDSSFMVRPQVVDARGRFAVEGLPAGTYEVFAQSFIPGSRTRPPSTRQTVTVTQGSVTEIELVIDLSASSTPRP